jgi:hypothetical protein
MATTSGARSAVAFRWSRQHRDTRRREPAVSEGWEDAELIVDLEDDEDEDEDEDELDLDDEDVELDEWGDDDEE